MRTGRASLALLDGVRVNYYGAPTPLAQVASLSVPDSRTIVIQPWDSKMTGEIEKAIQKSDLGLTPMNDGKVVRINIPPLTEERRKELVKVIKRMEEEMQGCPAEPPPGRQRAVEDGQKGQTPLGRRSVQAAGRSPETHRPIHREGRRRSSRPKKRRLWRFNPSRNSGPQDSCRLFTVGL